MTASACLSHAPSIMCGSRKKNQFCLGHGYRRGGIAPKSRMPIGDIAAYDPSCLMSNRAISIRLLRVYLPAGNRFQIFRNISGGNKFVDEFRLESVNFLLHGLAPELGFRTSYSVAVCLR